MIQVVCGLPGEGKTLYCSWLIEQLACVQSRRVVTNIELTEKHKAYELAYRIDYPDPENPGVIKYPIVSHEGCFFNWFDDGQGSVFVIDEADIFFDASDHAKILKQVKIYFKQHRKRKDDIILIVQFPENLWVRIRRLVNEWVWCYRDSKLNPPPGIPGFLFDFIPDDLLRFNRNTYAKASMQPASLIRSGYITTAEARKLYGTFVTEQLIGDVSFGVRS